MVISSQFVGKLTAGSDVMVVPISSGNRSGSDTSHILHNFTVPAGKTWIVGFHGSSSAGSSNEAFLYIGSDSSSIGWTEGTWIYGSGSCSVSRICGPGGYVFEMMTGSRSSVSITGSLLMAEM